jgi:hypothetical protein
MLWSRKTAPTHEKARHAGVDLNSSRARAVSVGVGKIRSLILDDPSEELQLHIALDRRTPEVGQVGVALCRKMPHSVCSNFLPALTQPREWRGGRHILTPETALEITLGKIRGPVIAESEAAALALPAYLTPAQVTKTVATAARAKFPLKGTAIGLLALVADRAASVLTGKPVAPEVAPPDWIVPLRPGGGGPGAVAVIDADEYALSVAVIAVERERVRLLATLCWPRFSVKAWKDRLLDAISDRCVRLCRRDPRDSADAEQALFEQLDDALDHARTGQRVSLTVRTDRWFQDISLNPDEFDGCCAALARGAAESVRDLVAVDGTGLVLPPRAVWLTHDAGRLPGLARAIQMNTPEGTAVEVLPQTAVAQAAAALVPRWLAAELPRVHLDTTIPLAGEGRGARGEGLDKKITSPRPSRPG